MPACDPPAPRLAANNMILEALGAALFASTVGNGDLFLDARGLVVVVPMLVLCGWIVLSGQLKLHGVLA